MNTYGLERSWERTGKLGARVGLRPPLIALSACAVFAGSFAIARASHSSAQSHGEAAPNLPVATVSAVIPVRLTSAQPIESTLEPPPPPPVRPSAKPATGSATASPSEAALAPATTSSEPVAPAPAPPAPSAPAPSRPSSGGGASHSPPSSGGSFESSG
jgi:hypothetical protein